ncbi:unnamed protein product [Pieris macdunnoughi]|uniref:Beta-galactosidase n=1 Tax=Pieris macdunnoughi TaxID=345717 RepID=A0A821MU83_9NEOP|nr:unnamed protein product [Pieris macdunnoughi]
MRHRIPFILLQLIISFATYLCEDSTSSVPSVIQLKELVQGSELEAKSPRFRRNISIVGNEFMLENTPFRIMSGSIHYFRVPHEYWRDRLRKLKAAGLNSVSTYVEWSSHEPEEGIESFSGDNDIVKFLNIAQEEGLHVLFRPGPYICAERDLGGFPYWLLGKYPNIQLRTTDADFTSETKRWFDKLFALVKPLLYGNGGPVILVQVENEYGSYGASKKYMEKLRDIISEHVEDKAILYTTDGMYRSYFYDGSVSGVLTTIDFGPIDSVTKAFRDLRRFMPSGPLMNSEYYPGWLTHWTEDLQQVSSDRVVNTLRDMLEHNINFNFYMFHGGTNFGFTSGANYGSFYQPDITSYDYDAPISEAGDPTPKYFAIRDAITKLNPEVKHIPPPTISKKGAYGAVSLTPKIELLSNDGRTILGKKYNTVTGKKLPTFEELKQFSGLMLYETSLNGNGLLEIRKPRDWIFVYVDNRFQGVINRRYKAYSLNIKSSGGSSLSLLVENQGRINYGPKLHDYKGILSTVVFNNKTLEGPWTITGYPLDKRPKQVQESLYEPTACSPILFTGDFVLPPGDPLDTFVDMTGWGKGYITINGRLLGRYWPEAGPQATLYVPGVWLKPAPAQNVIEVVELYKTPINSTVNFIDYPILNRTATEYSYNELSCSYVN